jgi:hypothetical protein
MAAMLSTQEKMLGLLFEPIKCRLFSDIIFLFYIFIILYSAKDLVKSLYCD